jgi:hypothetical protein
VAEEQIAYYVRRQAQELKAAARADCLQAAAAHRQMAEFYGALAHGSSSARETATTSAD